jgi:KUP system potassium uptake protein
MKHSNSEAPSILRLALAALGVVFGDIGTSPIYALRESFQHHLVSAQETGPSPEMVIGVLSLLCWTMIIVVSLKYVLFVLRAIQCPIP